jgi:hypothetical protein
VRNDGEDKLQKSVSAVSVGQEKLENRSLNQALKLQTAKADAGPSAKLHEVTRVRGGTPLTPPERRWDGRPVCWRCRKPGHFRKESSRSRRRIRTELGGEEEAANITISLTRFTLNVLAKGTEDRMVADG